MKFKILIVLAGLLLLSTESFSEESYSEYGAKIGMNISTLNGEKNSLPANGGLIDASSKLGGLIGINMNIIFSEKFSIQSELLMTMKGVTYDAEEYVQKQTYYYLELPLLFKTIFKLQDRYDASLYAGPALSYLALSTAYIKNNNTLTLDDEKIDKINDIDLGVVIGGDMYFNIFGADLCLDARYTYGLLSTNDRVSTQNGTISVSLGYIFNSTRNDYY